VHAGGLRRIDKRWANGAPSKVYRRALTQQTMDEPRLFLVRVWQHLSQFRAAVRGVDEAEPRLFEEPAQLSEYLRQASAAPSPPAEPDHAPANAWQTPPR
jgi:hypothetical protein